MDMGSPPKKRLGRGLAALIGEDTSEESVVQDVRSLRHMPIDLLKASPNNPRKSFAEADLENLKWEPSRGGDLFPHVYGVIPTGLAAEVHPLPLVNGVHQFPEAVA